MAGSSVGPSSSRAGARLSDTPTGRVETNSNNQRTAGEGGALNYSHMTLDGRRRPRNTQRDPQGPSNGADHWNDWTSTWRRMGTKGQSQAVTMTGTVTRGKKRGQVVDVQLDLTDRELMEISSAHDHLRPSTPQTPDSMHSSGFEPDMTQCQCGVESGPHIIFLSILAFPFVFVSSLFVSFYFGALTWQNIFSYFYDERTIWHRIFLCPLLVLSFPIFIIVFTLGIAIYAAFIQLRWSFMKWKNEVGSLEKGFYGWLCGKVGLEDCSPYTVIELFSSSEPGQNEEYPADDRSDGRVAVVYSEQSNQSERPHNNRRSNTSLPNSTGHARMERVESAM